MKIVKKSKLGVDRADTLILPVFQRTECGGLFQEFPESRDFAVRHKFKGRIGQEIVFNSATYNKLIVLLGMGDPQNLSDWRQSARRVMGRLQEHQSRRPIFYFVQTVELKSRWLLHFIDYLLVNAYLFDRYRRKKEPRVSSVTLVFKKKNDLMNSDILERIKIDHHVVQVRDLVNDIPEKVNPDTLVATFRSEARQSGLSCKVWRTAELEKNHLPGILAVGRTSPHEPALVKIAYCPKKFSQTVVIVGKGITFDSGGLNIKTGQAMEEMKSDMAGAAVVLGVLKAVRELQVSARVIGLAAIAENMPGSKAYKPGDILTYRNKKTVEVVNTDAEGRLALADALILAKEEKPDFIVEFSTLTGAILVALGDCYGGLMCRHKRLTRLLLRAAETSGDLLWELPLFEGFKESIQSKIADLKNSSYSNANSIKAGMFLNEFTAHVPFAHLDIAGTAFLSKSNYAFRTEGATGFGVRLMVEFFKLLA